MPFQYQLRADIKRSAFSKDLTKTMEFFLEQSGAPETGSEVLYHTYYICTYVCIMFILGKVGLVSVGARVIAPGITANGLAPFAMPSLKVQFSISPQSLENVKDRAKVPNFLVEGTLTTATCSIIKPFTGQVALYKCQYPQPMHTYDGARGRRGGERKKYITCTR